MSKENIVFALVRNKESALKVPGSVLSTSPSNVHIIQADVTDTKGLKVRFSSGIQDRGLFNFPCKSAAEKVKEITGGSLDILIYNAAVLNEGNG